MTTPPPGHSSRTESLVLNLIATAVYVLIGVALSKMLGLSDALSLIVVAVVVIIGGSILILALSTSIFRTISSPYSAIVLSLLILSILINAYSFVKPLINTTVTIQSLQPMVFNFGGKFSAPNAGGTSSFNVRYLSDGNAEYSVGYSLPQGTGNDWAGLSFRFKEKRDFSQYKTLKLKIVFGDPQKGGDSESNSYLAIQGGGKKATINLRDATGFGTLNERTITIDLQKDIQGIDLSSVEEISFNTDGNYPRGDHTYNISYIELSK